MSHFTVAVFTKEDQNIEDLLAPYQENNMGDCPEEYLKFHDIEDEYRSNYEEDSTEWVKMPDSRLLLPWDDEFRKENSFGHGSDTHNVPDNLEKVQVRFKDKFKTFEEYMYEWCGYEERDCKTNRYGYWENPNAKWDWYAIGGRWSNLLKIKPTLYLTNNSNFNKFGFNLNEFAQFVDWFENDKQKFNKVINKYKNLKEEIIEEIKIYIEMREGKTNFVDSAKVKDIDFSIDENKYNDALRFWELIIEGNSSLNSKEEDIIKWNFYKPEYYIREYETKEQYAKLTSELETYAVITPDGVWHSKGEMGWFGCGSESEEDSKQWNKSFKENFIDTADPEWTLTIVDCHI